jgi:arylamine N-acetyltransferase
VHDLPSDANPSGDWYVDAGLGDALHEPLPLAVGSYHQGPFHLDLREVSDGVGDWHLQHDPAGSFAGMAWRSEPTEISAFAERHEWLSAAPESGFVRVLAAQRRDATGVDILRGLVLSRVGDGAGQWTLTTQAELMDAFADVFRLDVGEISTERWSTLWAKLHEAHQRWEAAGRP